MRSVSSRGEQNKGKILSETARGAEQNATKLGKTEVKAIGEKRGARYHPKCS